MHLYKTGARIQLSRNQEVFPGTTDRLVILSGTASAILGALHLMIKKLIADGEGMAGGALPQVKLVVPNSSCGCIIGKGGATIRTFVEDSQAEIKLSPQDRMPPGGGGGGANNHPGLKSTRLVSQKFKP